MMFDKNGTGNNGTNGNVGINGIFSILGFRMGSLGLRFNGLGLGGGGFEKLNINVPFLLTFPFLPFLPKTSRTLYFGARADIGRLFSQIINKLANRIINIGTFLLALF